MSYAADISGERLEEEFDGNFDYMNRIFKRVTGQEVGYPDEYYFSKVFKRNVGMPPRVYAESLSKNKL